ncbi:MAG: tRNA (5-methylaminomethyl-2-thiouridylate)-methyltransferase [Fidelibacterota bacterium]
MNQKPLKLHENIETSGKIKAVGLLSGGLDSTLAAKIMIDMGIEVYGINFSTGFCLTDHRRMMRRSKDQEKTLRNEALRAGSDLRIPVEIVDISREYWDILSDPKHGYGSAINPCIDCRIMMLEHARRYMEQIKAHFIFTGEVLGQRPMTQHRPTLMLIEKESNLEGLLLRPLSARLLPPTVPEKKGWVKREYLYSIHGRSRKPQIRLAQRFNITDYPQPAGGCCFLVDENFARKLDDLFKYKGKERPGPDDLSLLKVGRHFRISERVKVIVGRDEGENNFLLKYRGERIPFRVLNFEGPITLLEGEPAPEEIEKAARITARYSDGKSNPMVEVQYEMKGIERIIKVKPLDQKSSELENWRI